jgi:hypothetical protein
MARVIGHVEEMWSGRMRRFKYLVCHCGHEMALYDSWSNECNCGTEYNGGGQQLAPRSQWGEETGERF